VQQHKHRILLQPFFHAMHAHSIGPIPSSLVMQSTFIITIGCQAKE
jgi:hypothetical protein